MRLFFINLQCTFLFSIPTTFEEMMIIPNNCCKWFNIVEVNGKKTIEWCTAVNKIEEDQAPTFSIRRIGSMFYYSSIQEDDSVTIVVKGYPCSSGISIFWE